MRLPEEDNKFISQWKFVEVARYVGSLDRVIRDKVGDDPLFYDYSNIDEYRGKHNNTGLYTSIWHYNTTDLSKAIRLGSLYFDIDNEDIAVSYSETISLYNYLSKFIPEKSIVVYFTGKKGFHIECEAIALGINPTNELPKIFRYIATSIKNLLDLKSLDFSVYDMRRMWRLPGSKHQSTGLYKTLLSKEILFTNIENILSFCSQRHDCDVLEQDFNYTANEWYRKFIYDMEEENSKPKDVLDAFNKYGSSKFKSFDSKEKVFQKEVLWTKCPSVKRLDDQAKDTGFLEHEARLFLCSILTYNEDSINYLHKILSQCNDYNPGKSQAHINDWIKRREMGIGGRPYTCERANAVGVGCGTCALEKKNKWIKIGDRFVETTEKSSPSPVRFAYSTIKKENKDG